MEPVHDLVRRDLLLGAIEEKHGFGHVLCDQALYATSEVSVV